MSTTYLSKTLLRVLEKLTAEPEAKFTAETIIKDSGLGRTAAFSALEWLGEHGLAETETVGRQKLYSARKSLQGLSLRLYIDSIAYKSLPSEVKLAAGMLVDRLKGTESIKSVMLFGSVLKHGSFNDVDIMIIHNGIVDRKKIAEAREEAELLCSKPISLHFSIKPDIRGICIYGFDYYVSLLEKREPATDAFNEALEWLKSAQHNAADRKLMEEGIGKALVHLAFCYSALRGLKASTKREAVVIFPKKFSKAFKLSGRRKLDEARKAATAIGKELYC